MSFSPKIIDDVNYKCQKVHVTQRSPKNLIPQLHHIVLDFGILLQMNLYNLDDLRLNKNGTNAASYTIEHPLGHRMTPAEKITTGILPMENIVARGRTLTPVEYKDLARLITKSSEMIKRLKIGIYQMHLNQANVTTFMEKINTILKLRVIDIRICNHLKNPPVSGNNSHIILFEAIQHEAIPILNGRISMLNLAASVNSSITPIIVPAKFYYSSI